MSIVSTLVSNINPEKPEHYFLRIYLLENVDEKAVPIIEDTEKVN